MHEVELVGGPWCGQLVAVRTGQIEIIVPQARIDCRQDPFDSVALVIGRYAPRGKEDAVLGRWWWQL